MSINPAPYTTPKHYKFSQQSRAKNQSQWQRIKRKLLDACSHPLCSTANRHFLKQVIQREYRYEWNGQPIMIYEEEWPHVSLALRDFVADATNNEYQIMLQAERRYRGLVR